MPGVKFGSETTPLIVSEAWGVALSGSVRMVGKLSPSGLGAALPRMTLPVQVLLPWRLSSAPSSWLTGVKYTLSGSVTVPKPGPLRTSSLLTMVMPGPAEFGPLICSVPISLLLKLLLTITASALESSAMPPGPVPSAWAFWIVRMPLLIVVVPR